MNTFMISRGKEGITLYINGELVQCGSLIINPLTKSERREIESIMNEYLNGLK